MSSKEKILLQNIYNDQFYESQISGSYKSAAIYSRIIYSFITPNRIADIGCGRGTWLKAFKEMGATELIGFDGYWNSKEKMLDSTIMFQSINLDDFHIEDNLKKRVDLAISLEVIEHLKANSATNFIKNLTKLSDVVLFSGAYKGQGGDNHISEQKHSDWAKIFLSLGYQPFDIFRPIVWGNKDIPFWYQQNVFLYVKNESNSFFDISTKGLKPISNIHFMDCIHPVLFERETYSPEPGFVKKILQKLPKSLKKVIRKIIS